jgi:two-component system sensor histidine kinase ResE
MENLTPFKGDYDRLKQILTIFVDNAIKYSPKNTVIDLYLNAGELVTIIVEDHGYGIPEDEIPYIWDQYYRTKKTASEKGYGLGLAIAKQLIELHNGTVEIQSKLNMGTKVILKLPK